MLFSILIQDSPLSHNAHTLQAGLLPPPSMHPTKDHISTRKKTQGTKLIEGVDNMAVNESIWEDESKGR